MIVQIERTWNKEVPEEWETLLRGFSPYSRVIPWLALRWYPCYRAIDGVFTDCGRWLLSECVPEEVIPENQRDILQFLGGPRPSSLEGAARTTREMFVNDYQWEMYRTHRVWARELWVIQGDAGGHATSYDATEQEIRQAKGLPVEPPALGDLPYAPFDQRVVSQMLRRNRLVRLKMTVDEMRRSNAETVQREMDEALKEARSEFVKFITEQSMSTADMVTWFSGKSDNRDLLPAATPGEIAAASAFAEQYTETGAIPSAA